MKSKFINVVVCLAVLAMLAVPAAFTPVASAAGGTPPVWSVGDNWVYNCSYDSGPGVTPPVVNTGELNVTTTDTTGDNYTLLADYVPDANRVDATTGFALAVSSADQYVIKANMQNQKQYATILALGVIADNATIEWAYAPPPPGYPPLAPWSFTKHTTDAMGIVNVTTNRVGMAVGLETITVPAGTFSCLHIVEYDPADPANIPTPTKFTYEHWFSETAGSDVKMIDRETYMGVETRELTSTNHVPPVTNYTLTLNAGSGGSITGATSGTQYLAGTQVTLTAVPASGYSFTGWSGGATGTINPVTITMDADKTVVATFASNGSAFYFAEVSTGTTRTNFQEYLCLGNSGDKAASAQVTYLFTDGTTKDASYTVPANSRYTVDVNSVVGPNKDLSLKVLSDSPNLVAERPMYFNYNGVWTGGSDAVGATAPNTKWYFAEGNTLPEFDQYITVLNPGSTKANLKFHYMVEGRGEEEATGAVGAHTRATFKTKDQIGNGKHVSLYLESTQGVVAERPMYFNYVGLAQNNWTGGHDAVGTNSPNTNWYFAEGTTRKNSVDGAFEQWLCLQNPGTKPLTVTATYQLAAGQGNPISKTYTVPAQQRLTVSVNKEIGQDKDCSVYLHSTSNFMAERPMYFSYHAYAWTGGHDVLGVNSTATTWFFGEGSTRTDFEEWLCLQNPGNADAHTTITYYTTSGQVINKSWTVKANTRLTVSANSDVGPNQDISAKVVSDKPIIVERPMYFNFQGVGTGGHDVVGFVPTQ